MMEPVWLPYEEVVNLNRIEVALTGENHAVKDQGGIEGAVARPQQHFAYADDGTNDDIVLLAAKLCTGISQAQGFENGNKRAALGAMDMFLQLNGFMLHKSARDYVGQLIIQTAHPDRSQRLSDRDFADQLDPFIVELSADMIVDMFKLARANATSTNADMAWRGYGLLGNIRARSARSHEGRGQDASTSIGVADVDGQCDPDPGA